MMVSWHNWKLKLKRYWFSVWCWWSKWKDASWSQCNFPGRSTEDPGRSKSGVAAPQDIPPSYTCSTCNFTTQKAEDTPTTSSSGVPDARAKPGWGIILHFFKELLFWCCLHVWFLLFVWFCLTFYFAVFEEALCPCAPRLALSRMVSPPPPTVRQKTVRFFQLPNIVIETISMIVLQGSWRCPEPQGCAWEDRECFPHWRAEDRQEGARGSGQKRSEMGFLDLE